MPVSIFLSPLSNMPKYTLSLSLTHTHTHTHETIRSYKFFKKSLLFTVHIAIIMLKDIQVDLAFNTCFICSIKCVDWQHQVQASDGLWVLFLQTNTIAGNCILKWTFGCQLWIRRLIIPSKLFCGTFKWTSDLTSFLDRQTKNIPVSETRECRYQRQDYGFDWVNAGTNQNVYLECNASCFG